MGPLLLAAPSGLPRPPGHCNPACGPLPSLLPTPFEPLYLFFLLSQYFLVVILL